MRRWHPDGHPSPRPHHTVGCARKAMPRLRHRGNGHTDGVWIVGGVKIKAIALQPLPTRDDPKAAHNSANRNRAGAQRGLPSHILKARATLPSHGDVLRWVRSRRRHLRHPTTRPAPDFRIRAASTDLIHWGRGLTDLPEPGIRRQQQSPGATVWCRLLIHFDQRIRKQTASPDNSRMST